MEIWDFEYKTVVLTTKKGNRFRGYIFDIMDKDEMDTPGAILSIEAENGLYYGISEEEVESIEIIE